MTLYRLLICCKISIVFKFFFVIEDIFKLRIYIASSCLDIDVTISYPIKIDMKIYFFSLLKMNAMLHDILSCPHYAITFTFRFRAFTNFCDSIQIYGFPTI